MSPLSDDLRRRDSEAEVTRQWHRMAGLGFEFVAAIAVFGGIGWVVGWLTGSMPWALVAGMGLGFVVGLWQLIRVGMRSLREEEARAKAAKTTKEDRSTR